MKKIITLIILVLLILSNQATIFATGTKEENINRLAEYGIDTDIMDKNISRIEFLKMLFNTLDMQIQQEFMIFEDVIDKEQQKYLVEFYRLGIACGIERNGKIYFEPNRNVTWGEMIAFVVRCIAINPPSNIEQSIQYAIDMGLIKDQKYNINDTVDREYCYQILDRLLDFKSCFSYKYSTNKIFNDIDYSIYVLKYMEREQQSLTYDQIHEYRKQIVNRGFDLINIDEQVSISKFTDYSFDINEYLGVESFFNDSYYITKDQYLKDDWDENDISELYSKYIPKYAKFIYQKDSKYHLQDIHNPESGVWIIGQFHSIPYFRGCTLSPILLCYDNNKDITVYQPYLPKF